MVTYAELLSFFAGGDAKMMLVVTVSPMMYSQRETLHSLGFGTRARQVARGPAKKRVLPSLLPSPSPNSNPNSLSSSFHLVTSASAPNLHLTQQPHAGVKSPPSIAPQLSRVRSVGAEKKPQVKVKPNPKGSKPLSTTTKNR